MIVSSHEIIGHGTLCLVREGEGNGPTVLFLHGIPTHKTLWEEVSERLRHRFQILRVDLLGYGDSSKPRGSDLGVSAQAGYIETLLNDIDETPDILVGHDIGGGVAQLVSLSNTHAPKGLVLIDTIAYDSWPEPTIRRLADPEWDERIGQIDLTAGFAKGLSKGLIRRLDRVEDLARVYSAPFSGSAGRNAYLRAARALNGTDLSDRIEEIEALSCPTLILWGADDQFQEVSYGQRLASALSNGRLETVPNAGHFLPHDAPSEIAEAMTRFSSEVLE